MVENNSQTLTFRGLDGYAGFRHGQAYTVGITREDDGTGKVLVSMPHALGKGPAKFTAQQWVERWNRK